jgi:hypothetical protein
MSVASARSPFEQTLERYIDPPAEQLKRVTSNPCKRLHLTVAYWARSRGDYAASSTHSTGFMHVIKGPETQRSLRKG